MPANRNAIQELLEESKRIESKNSDWHPFLQVFYVFLIFAALVLLLYTFLIILHWIYSHSGLKSWLAGFRRRGYDLISGNGEELCDSRDHH